ncbi:DUF397 domain-containing protein [Streptomyces sp. I05A-00742]|uniref:DUF397 domain-containing protein n=1 Tax=Streptomyces sp. I05A-00742 TaxID=2732853 RepID=UPI0014884CAC|nr:DUF397 domain-containing protein [Streptomyces sp. I05A-00742]
MSSQPGLTRTQWVKSSFSSGQGGQCLEWAPSIAATGIVPIRDSKHPQGPALTFPSDAWHSFVTGLKHAG